MPTEISDTVALRQRIAQQFEMASIPGTPDTDKWVTCVWVWRQRR